ncbi:MAG TPA: RidA family protein [Vicinamibacterales bacterium]|nr:RidA family protein [Vicinamibacterales bacterium]
MRLTAPAALLAAMGVLAVHAQPLDTSSLPFRPAVVAGGLIYVSGVIATDAQGNTRGDIREQTRIVLQRINEVLAAHKVSLHDAVKITVYLKRADDFGAMNEVYKTFVGDAPAPRTTVVANLMVPDALIEVSAIAAASGTSRRVLHPQGWLRSPNPYSYAVEAGDTVFLSGLVARNAADNSLVPGDMTAQCKTVLENARALLNAAGLGFEHVVSARVFVTDLSQFQAMNQVYRTYFPKAPPARATVRAALMQPSYLVEMTFVASRAPREVIAGDGPPNPNLSPAVRAGSRLYLSGMLGVTPDSRSDAGAQTRETLRRLGATMTKAGFAWSDVVDSIVYLTRVSHFGAMNAAYREIVPRPFPARATVEAGLAAPDGLVEIMMTAVKPQ